MYVCNRPTEVSCRSMLQPCGHSPFIDLPIYKSDHPNDSLLATQPHGMRRAGPTGQTLQPPLYCCCRQLFQPGLVVPCGTAVSRVDDPKRRRAYRHLWVAFLSIVLNHPAHLLAQRNRYDLEYEASFPLARFLPLGRTTSPHPMHL